MKENLIVKFSFLNKILQKMYEKSNCESKNLVKKCCWWNVNKELN